MIGCQFSHSTRGGVIRESTLGLHGTMHILLVAFTLGGPVAGQMVLGIPLGFAILPILSFSLDVCGYRSRVSKNTITYCVTGHHLYLPRSSVGLFIAYFFVAACWTTGYKGLENLSDAEPQRPGNSPRSFWRCSLVTQFK